ncbi:hypothetical protein AURDEDRAFT_170971 [Auricularia subglabra TFB-10046 SS5]|nr:hypothetical protein AURDEDRAFT_170971 [Auricularia subglabra TFB-10046 SS5]
MSTFNDAPFSAATLGLVQQQAPAGDHSLLQWHLHIADFRNPDLLAADSPAGTSAMSMSPDSFFNELSPTSSFSSLELDSLCALTPPMSEFDPSGDITPVGHPCAPSFSSFAPVSVPSPSLMQVERKLPPLTLDSLKDYSCVSRELLTVVRRVVRPLHRVFPSKPGPVRTAKVSRQHRQNLAAVEGKPRAKAPKKAARATGDKPFLCLRCDKAYSTEVMYREHLQYTLHHDDEKSDAELPPVRWVCPYHRTPFTVPTSLQRHCSGDPRCNELLKKWCKSVGITREEYLSLNYDKEFCHVPDFKSRTLPGWRRRVDVTLARGGLKEKLD